MKRPVEDWQMKAGMRFYGLGTVFTGILNMTWGDFDASHQPIRSLGKDIPGQHILALVAAVWLIASGLAILWRRSAKIGVRSSAIAYLIFAALWLPRYYAAIHALGWRMDVLLGVSFGLAQQVMLVAPGSIVFASTASPDSPLQSREALAARWMLGLPPVVFGLFHLAALRVFAGIVPKWMGFGEFWAVLTGIAFLLAGCAILSGMKDVLAARLLALMLLLFEGFVEVPPIVVRLHSLPTWGAAVYNLAAIGACLIFAGFLSRSQVRPRIENAEKADSSDAHRVVA